MDHIGLRLREIFLGQKTGQMTFMRGGIQKSFLFQDGGLIFAKTNVSEERLGEVLFRTGKISADVQATLPKYSQPNQFIGESLVQRRLITQGDLYDALLAQINVIALTCFSFFDATINFQPLERFIDQEFELRVSLPLIIERGIRGMEYHPALKAFFSEKTPVPKGVSAAPYLAEDEQNLWKRADSNTPADLLQAMSGNQPEKFWKTLYLFYCLDLIDLKEEMAPSEPPFVRPADRPPEPRPGVGPPAAEKTPAPPSAGRPASTPAWEEQIAEALELHRKLAEFDYFQLLGVSRTADDGEVKKAYFKLARRFHPDLFGRNLDPGTKAKIDEVFDHITKAYRTLTSKEDKDAYTKKGATPARPDEDKDRGKSADTRFRQAKTLFNAGRFEEAALLLEEAIRLKDDKGDYYLLLALSESRVPALSKKAERDFLKAIELEPWNPEPHVGLGVLFKKEGLMTRARREFERALEVDAEHHLARRELAEMDKAEKKGLKGLFHKDIFGAKKK
jgi:tetratricopeptide (TPR) repeat protein